MGRRGAAIVVAIVALMASPSARADAGSGAEPPPSGFSRTIHVPADVPTIQEAVDHVRPGGMVLIAPGVYREQVTVTTPYVTIRGEDRNRTIVDGGFQRANGIEVLADGVVIQNLTARHTLANGFAWIGVHGFWGSYLTAYGDGEHGLFAEGSTGGQLDHAFASGHPGSGIAVAGCDPCDVVVTDVEATGNGVGFLGSNTGQDLTVIDSAWHEDGAGIVLATQGGSGTSEHGALIAGNDVHDIGASIPTTPAAAAGIGIAVVGGRDTLIAGNRVEDAATYGVALLPIVDSSLWVTGGDTVRDNAVRRTGVADLALGAPAGAGDCFAGNDAETSQPPAIEDLYPCDGLRPFPAGGGSMAPTVSALTLALGAGSAADVESAAPAPPAQPQMQGEPSAAPPIIAVGGDNVPQPYAIRPVADIATSSGPTVSAKVAVLGVPLATSWGDLLIGLYGYVLPFVLLATWVAVAMWDLIRQESAPLPHRARWMLVVLVVPFIGPLLYFAFGRSPIPRELRLVLTVGGVAVYLVFLGLGVLLS